MLRIYVCAYARVDIAIDRYLDVDNDSCSASYDYDSDQCVIYSTSNRL